ncbi:MAG: glycine zipper 2TM domain-containing protein [Alphaproteobacteria bacterium]|nr:glycine zipper 2TM domain-containing protein [Alphaproteobacteria bacterium]
MKHLAIFAAAGSLAFFAAPAQAVELPAPPAVAAFNHSANPMVPVASYDRDRYDDRRKYRGRDRDDRRYNDGRRYDNDRRYDRDRRHHNDRYDGRRLSRNDRVWRGNDGRYRCRRDDGTVGLVIGAGVGALIGREVDNRGDRALGTIVGAVGGGLLGREVDRGGARCR